MMRELKLCPFCGGEAVFHEHERVGVECIECGAGFACVYRDRDEAAEEWNRRAERTCRMEYAGEVPPQIQYSCYFCSECGSPIYNDMEPRYCLYCGAKVVDE